MDRLGVRRAAFEGEGRDDACGRAELQGFAATS
jgi:hypothetical protein